MARTKDETIREVTHDYLANLNMAQIPDEATIAADLIEKVHIAFDLENSVKPKGEKWQIPKELTAAQLADIMLCVYHIINIDMLVSSGGHAGGDQTLLAMYHSSGPNEGIYVSEESMFRNLAKRYSYNISDKDIARMMQILRDEAPIKKRCEDPNLIAVNNGIFDYQTKTLQPFSPDYVFIAKSQVNYNPNATNVLFHNPDDNTDWDVDKWMRELTDDDEILDLLWKLLGAMLRPFVPWNKAAWFYSEVGNNGKGTLCSLMKNLVGEGAYTTIPLSDFSKDFILESLTHSSAIITDENDVGVFIDKAANLKSIIKGDSVLINRKFKNSISYMFRGMMVQCVNELPRVKDKSDSFYRRQLVIPFYKCFTGRERKYIKEDYLKRPEVLEYVMFKVLNMDYYELPEPTACCDLLGEYKAFNDPVRQFVEEILPICQWSLLPFTFLYDLYKAWFRENSPSGSIQGRNTFVHDLLNVIQMNPLWSCPGTDKRVRSKGRMDKPEHLIIRYQLKNWMNPNYTGSDPDQICRPPLCDLYTGLERI